MTLLDRALRVIPSGTMTFSKARSSWPAIAPTHLRRGRGSHVWDDDEIEYIDFAIGLGAVTLGYQDTDVETAVADQLADGPLFSLSHPIEVEVAERLTEIIPCAKDGQAKFFKTGSDATSAAVRVARAYTGRDLVLSSGYHGWHDWTVGNRVGVPEPTCELTSDLEAWRWDEIARGPAAIVVEPNAYGAGGLKVLRSLCDKNGVVLIFDEVLTGFRIALGGYQELTGVTPDLTCLSKAMGNGYAIAAVVGKREVMQTFEWVGVSGTFGGDTIGLAAAKAVIDKYQREPAIKRLWDVGWKLQAGFRRAATEFAIPASAEGAVPFWIPKFERDDADVDPIIRRKKAALPWRTLWRQEMIRRGILVGPAYVFSSYAHADEDVEKFLIANREAFKVLASVDDPAELLIGDAAGGGVRAA